MTTLVAVVGIVTVVFARLVTGIGAGLVAVAVQVDVDDPR